MTEQRVSVTVAGHIAQVRLNRPDKMNALDPAMFSAIGAAIDRLATMRDVRAVVLAGQGRAFCAGLDMASMAGGGSGLDVAERDEHGAALVQKVALGWRKLPVPVIAAAHGVAFGGGFQILSGADIRIAHPATRCAIMEAKWGLVADMAGWPLWRGSVRDDVLRELAFTAREFSGVEAQDLGFVTQLDDDPIARATALATEIAARSPHAVRAAKQLANAMHDLDERDLLALETREQLALLRSANQVEAVSAALGRRTPVFADS